VAFASKEPDRRSVIEGDRATLASQVESLEVVFSGFVESSELVATDDEHDPEGHTIAFERQQVAGLLRDAKIRLADLDRALKRLDDGTYGTCASCGSSITDARLDAMPGTARCIDCARSGA
jgi:RNA polymerase-binding transcription factor DksA